MAGGLAGLAGAATGSSSCSSQTSAGSSRNLQVWGGVPAESGPQAVVDAFMKRNPEYTVTYTRFINDDRGNLKLDTALQGGVDIDVYFTYDMASMALRAGSGLVLDLTDRVAAEPVMEPFLDETVPRAHWDGDRITSLATTQEPNFILCNEQRLNDAGVALPTAWDVDDFEAAALELTQGQTYGAYELPETPRIAIGPDCWYRGNRSNFGAPEFLDYFQRSRQLIDDGVTYPWTEVLSRQLENYQQDGFVQEDFALWLTAPFSLRYLYDEANYPHDFRVACSPVPTMGPDSWNSGTYGNFVMINPNSRRQDLAWEFIKFWITEGAEAMAVGGKIPTLGNVDDDTMLSALLGPEADRFFDVDSFRRVLFDDPPKLFVDTELTAYPEIQLATEQQRDLCWIGEKDPRDAVDDLRDNADAAIARFGDDD